MNNQTDPATPEYWKHKADNEPDEMLKGIYFDVYKKFKDGKFYSSYGFENMSHEEVMNVLDKAKAELEADTKELNSHINEVNKKINEFKEKNERINKKVNRRILSCCIFIIIVLLICNQMGLI